MTCSYPIEFVNLPVPSHMRIAWTMETKYVNVRNTQLRDYNNVPLSCTISWCSLFIVHGPTRCNCFRFPIVSDCLLPGTPGDAWSSTNSGDGVAFSVGFWVERDSDSGGIFLLSGDAWVVLKGLGNCVCCSLIKIREKSLVPLQSEISYTHHSAKWSQKRMCHK